MLVGLSMAFLAITSCDRSVKKHFCEGYIEYAIEYDDSIAPPKFNANMRPDKMVIKFKNNNTINKIEGLSGAFSFAFIQNKQDEMAYLLIKLLNKKLFYKEALTPEKYPFAFNEMPKLTIEETNRKEQVLGYNCNVAIGRFDDPLHKPFYIYYTQEINIANPNSNTPFEVIDGVMLKFTTIMFGQKMNILASSVKQTKISDEDFIIPKDYEEVDVDVVKDVVELLQ